MNLTRVSRYFSWQIFATMLIVIINLVYMHLNCAPDLFAQNCSVWKSICFICFDASLLLLIGSVVSAGRIKVACTIAFAISWLWSMTNVVYFRYFNTYINYHSILSIQNLADGAVIQSISGIFKISDLVWLLTLAAFIAATFIKEVKQYHLANILLPCFLCFFFVFISGGIKGIADMVYIWRNPFSRIFYLNKDKQLRDKLCFEKGIVFGEIFNDFITRSKCIKLSYEDRLEMAAQLHHLSINQIVTPPIQHNSIPTQRNLIFILVESFLSYTSDLSFDGKEVTPYLNKLKHMDGVYFNGKMKTNIALGQSFDGQFIYMTGLLPLPTEISAPRMFNQIIPSLPRMLKSNSCPIPFKASCISLATPEYTWFQNRMSPVYDIDKLYSMDRDGQDDELFANAATVDSAMEPPFFHMSVTMSMHAPFNSIHFNPEEAEYFNFTDDISNEMRNYLISCNFTDKCIGKYLNYLKKSDIYDNCVIVIASDHNMGRCPLGCDDPEVTKYIPLYIINSGLDISRCQYGEINQIDVFTSLLDLFGIHDSRWHGLGSSIWNAETYTDNYTPENIALSKKIIEGQYLNHGTSANDSTK